MRSIKPLQTNAEQLTGAGQCGQYALSREMSPEHWANTMKCNLSQPSDEVVNASVLDDLSLHCGLLLGSGMLAVAARGFCVALHLAGGCGPTSCLVEVCLCLVTQL